MALTPEQIKAWRRRDRILRLQYNLTHIGFWLVVIISISTIGYCGYTLYHMLNG